MINPQASRYFSKRDMRRLLEGNIFTPDGFEYGDWEDVPHVLGHDVGYEEIYILGGVGLGLGIPILVKRTGSKAR